MPLVPALLLISLCQCKISNTYNTYKAISLNHRAVEFYNQGHYQKSEEIARQSLDLALGSLGSQDRITAGIMNVLGKALHAQHKHHEAEEYYKTALSIRESVLGPEHNEVADSLDNLGRLFLDEERYDEAESNLLRAKDIHEKAKGPGSADMAVTLCNLGLLYRFKARFQEAESCFKKALAIEEKITESDRKRVALSLNNLGMIYVCQCRYYEAERCIRKALEINGKAYGKTHPLFSKNLLLLAWLYDEMGKWIEAETTYKIAFEIALNNFGKDDKNTTAYMNALAGCYREQERYSESIDLYNRSLEISRKALGENSPAVADTMTDLAIVYDVLGQYAEAEALDKKALAINEKIFGSGNRHSALCMNNLGYVYLLEGRYNEALTVLKAALATDEKTLGVDHPTVAYPLENLGVVLTKIGKLDEAESMLKRALALREKAYGADAPVLASSLKALAEWHLIAGNFTEAEALLLRALPLREKVYGLDHTKTATLQSALADALMEQGKHTEAEHVCRQALVTREKVLGPDHPDTATSLESLAELYLAQGKYTDAKRLISRSLAIKTKTLGPDHPETKEAAEKLASLKGGKKPGSTQKKAAGVPRESSPHEKKDKDSGGGVHEKTRRKNPFDDIDHLRSDNPTMYESIHCDESLIRNESWYIILDEANRLVYPDGGTLILAREIFKIRDAEGLEEASDIFVGYWPQESSLTFLEVDKNSGDGTWKPVSYKEHIIHEGLVQGIYKQEKVVSIIPEGIEIGDTIKFSYAMYVEPSKELPLYSVRIDWDNRVPVCRKKDTWEMPAGWDVRFKASGNVKNPSIPIMDGTKLVWEAANKEKYQNISDLPDDFQSYPSLIVAQKTSWPALNSQFFNIFEKYPSSEKIGSLSNEIAKTIKNDLDKIYALSSWTQKNIRYVGLSLDGYHLTPTNPETTLERKFGDCKDMSLLLVHLFRAQGIPSYVALTRSPYEGPLEPAVPGAGQFNHAIAAARVEGKWLFIDPTDSLASPPWSGAIHENSHVLVLDGLSDIMKAGRQNDSMHLAHVKYIMKRKASGDSLRVTAGQDSDMSGGNYDLVIETTYRGPRVSNMRSWYKNTSKEEIEHTVRNYYESTFPGLVLESLKYEWDESQKDISKDASTFDIMNPMSDGPTGFYYFAFIPEEIRQVIKAPDLTGRKYPWAQRYPISIDAEFLFYFGPGRKTIVDGNWSLKENEYIRLDREVEEKDGMVRVKWSMETLRQDVPEEKLGEYRELLANAVEDATFGMNLSIPIPVSKHVLGWITVVLLLQFFIMGLMAYTQILVRSLRWKKWYYIAVPVAGLFCFAIHWARNRASAVRVVSEGNVELGRWMSTMFRKDLGYIAAMSELLAFSFTLSTLASDYNFQWAVKPIGVGANIAFTVLFYYLVKRWSARTGSPVEGIGMIKWSAGFNAALLFIFVIFIGVAPLVLASKLAKDLAGGGSMAEMAQHPTKIAETWPFFLFMALARTGIISVGFASLFAPPPNLSIGFRIKKYTAMLGWQRVIPAVLASGLIISAATRSAQIVEHFMAPIPTAVLVAIDIIAAVICSLVFLILGLWLTINIVTLAMRSECPTAPETRLQ